MSKHFLSKGTTLEQRSTLLQAGSGRRPSLLEMEHEASAPISPSTSAYHRHRRGSRQLVEHDLKLVPIESAEDKEAAERDDDPSVSIKLEDETEKL